MSQFKIILEKPIMGSMTMSIIDNHLDKYHICFSYFPYNSLKELTVALKGIITDTQNEYIVRFFCDPTEYDLKFIKKSQLDVTVELTEYLDGKRTLDNSKTIYSRSGNALEICLPFWRALKSRSTDLNKSKWEDLYPTSELTSLSKLINRDKRLKP